jgi:hypothetical protein
VYLKIDISENMLITKVFVDLAGINDDLIRNGTYREVSTTGDRVKSVIWYGLLGVHGLLLYLPHGEIWQIESPG